MVRELPWLEAHRKRTYTAEYPISYRTHMRLLEASHCRLGHMMGASLDELFPALLEPLHAASQSGLPSRPLTQLPSNIKS